MDVREAHDADASQQETLAADDDSSSNMSLQPRPRRLRGEVQIVSAACSNSDVTAGSCDRYDE